MLFYTSPLDFESGVLGAETYGFDPDSDAAHLVYNVVRNKKEVDSVSSRISLGTAATEMTINGVKTGLGGLIYKGHTFYDLIDDPSAEGFLGYRKVFWQQEGAFGDYDTIVKALKHYSKMRYPPITTSFETYGVPGLKPLDIVALDNQLFYITEITHDIEADTNRWWMSISGKWLKQSMSELDVILPDVYGKQSGPSGSGGSGGNRDKF
jgi:hypothetical protein